MAENKQNPLSTIKKVSSIKKENFSLIWSINDFGEFLDRKYEFVSPLFAPNAPETSKWKLVLFPEIVYPEGLQIVLRLYNVSNDKKCYSVNYSVSLLNKNGSNHLLQYREKVFRNHLDYDQCGVASNRTIADKSLLQSNGTLTICCEMDLLSCEENQNDKTSESPETCKHICVQDMNDGCMTEENITVSEIANSIPALNDISVINKKLTKCESASNSTLAINNLSCETSCKEKNVKEKRINIDLCNVLPTRKTEMEEIHFNDESSKLNQGCAIYSNGYETSVLPEKVGCFSNSVKEKTTKKSWNLKNLDILSKDLNFLYTTKCHWDIIIHTKDGQLHAHKAILAARSEYFRKILAQNQEEIKILEINTITFDAILFYIYTGQSPEITFNQGMDILRVYDQFHLDHLKDMTQNLIVSQMKVNNVIDIFQIATEMKLENLKMSALKFIADNNTAVTNSTKWNEMISINPQGAGEILLTIAVLSKQQMIKE